MYRMLSVSLAIAGMIWAASASAVPYGSTVVGESAYIPACSSNNDLSTSLSVDVSSRLLVTIGGSVVDPDPSNGYGIQFWAQLFGADGTTLLAQSYGNSVSSGQDEVVIADSEVLVDPIALVPFQLAPGNYILKLSLQISGSCGGNGPYLQTPQLTYILLSSAFDRIFASGFASLASDGATRSV